MIETICIVLILAGLLINKAKPLYYLTLYLQYMISDTCYNRTSVKLKPN